MSPASARRSARVLPENPVRSCWAVVGFVALLYLVEFVDQSTGLVLDQYGVVPRETVGLVGILVGPLLHQGWAHLVSNTPPVAVLAFLATSGGLRRFAAVTAIVWFVSGAGTWLTGPAQTDHIGASGLAFGWLVFLLVRGFFARSAGQVLVAVVLFLCWGGMLWGLLPGQPGISWQEHLFGAVGGFLAARAVSRGGPTGSPRASGTMSG